jgi:amino acid transporter
VLIVIALLHGRSAPTAAAPLRNADLLGGVLIAMWNYMGWDNASTIAQEVERPRQTYPRAMIAAVILVSATYVAPFLAVYFAGIPASAFNGDGSWATVAGQIGGTILGFQWLRFFVTIGGMMSAFGMFNALVLSYSRLPLAMARDGMMPKVFTRVTRENKTPWVAVLVLVACWALCLWLDFKRLVTLDIMLYGAALMLEFVTLVALRIREPKLHRSFRVPGGMTGAVTCGLFPLALLILAMVESEHETILGVNGLIFGIIIMLAGVVVYFATRKLWAGYVAEARPEAAD